MAPRSATGVNLVLSSLLATLSYLPFELVAKATLIVCVVLFVLSPFPEARLVSVGPSQFERCIRRPTNAKRVV